MSITKLKGLIADAEILGTLREVLWAQASGELVIKSMTLEEAERAINLLSTGALAAVRPLECEPKQDGKWAAPVQMPQAVAPPVEKLAEVSPPFEPNKVAAVKPALAAVPSSPNGNGSVLATDLSVLTGMTSLGEVVVYLYERGYTTPDALVAECQKIKEDVPLLKRVANLSERIARAFEIKGLSSPP